MSKDVFSHGNLWWMRRALENIDPEDYTPTERKIYVALMECFDGHDVVTREPMQSIDPGDFTRLMDHFHEEIEREHQDRQERFRNARQQLFRDLSDIGIEVGAFNDLYPRLKEWSLTFPSGKTPDELANELWKKHPGLPRLPEHHSGFG